MAFDMTPNAISVTRQYKKIYLRKQFIGEKSYIYFFFMVFNYSFLSLRLVCRMKRHQDSKKYIL